MRKFMFMLGITCLGSLANASPIYTFAGFQERSSGSTVFGFLNYTGTTNNTTTGTFAANTVNNPCGSGNTCHVFTTVTNVATTTTGGKQYPTSATTPGSIPVFFDYQAIAGILPASLQGNLLAHMDMTLFTSTNAQSQLTFGTYFTEQPFDSGTITFKLDTPITSGVPGCTPATPCSNLLTVTLGTLNQGLTGARGGNTANLNADAGGALNDSISFSSDFLNFSSDASDQIAMSFTSVSPCFTRDNQAPSSGNVCNTGLISSTNLGNFLRTFVAAGSGTFAASPAPTSVIPTPEPASTSLMFSGVGLLVIRKLLARRSNSNLSRIL